MDRWHLKSLLVAAVLLGSLVPAVAQPPAKEVDYHAPGAPIPPLKAVSPSGTVYTNSSFSGKGNLFLMMFNPTCDHCEDMARLFAANKALFRNSNVLMVAGPMMAEFLPDFVKRTNVAGNPRIFVGVDSSRIIDNTFNYQPLPQINVYDHDFRLIRTFAGTTPLDSLKRYIE